MNEIIIGNSLACLVSAYELGRRGEKVTLIKHRGPWGAHFGGIEACGTHFDAGMSIVELTSNNYEAKPDLGTYDAEIRNDVGRFNSLVESFLRTHVPLREIRQPESYFRGSWNSDFLLCNSFEVLGRMNSAERKLIAEQIAGRDCKSWKHASLKVKRQDLHAIGNYLETSIYNHGAHAHSQLIEPFVRKLTGGGAEAVSSLYHRRLWCPLYYPETFREAALAGGGQFGETVMHYPANNTFRAFGDALVEKLRSMDNVEMVANLVAGIDASDKAIHFEGGRPSLRYSKFAWGGKILEAQLLLGIDIIQDSKSKRANLAFDLLLVDSSMIENEFSIVFIIDGNVPSYRITNLSVCSGQYGKESRLMIEYNTDHLVQRGIITKEQIHNTSVATLIEMGIISNPAAIIATEVKVIPQLLPLCSIHYNECTKANTQLIREACPEIAFMGDSSGITTRSFADNIVHGLKFAETGRV